MPIYVLGARNQRVQIPNRALAISISGSVHGAALVVHAWGDQSVMQPNPHLVVLPRVSGPVSVGVVPATGTEQFPAGTEICLAIAHNTASDLDPVQVVFGPVDVSGDSSVELATLTPRGAGIEVSAAAAADSQLSPLASAARTSARKVLKRGTRAARGPVLLALDASASMLPMFANGSVAAATEVVVGVADAAGISDVSAILMGAEPVSVSCAAAAELAEAVGHATPRWSAGACWSRLPDSGAHTIVCSDFPTRTMLQRFVVLAISDDRCLDTDCVRMPPPGPGMQAGVELLADSDMLDRITSSLARALT